MSIYSFFYFFIFLFVCVLCVKCLPLSGESLWEELDFIVRGRIARSFGREYLFIYFIYLSIHILFS